MLPNREFNKLSISCTYKLDDFFFISNLSFSTTSDTSYTLGLLDNLSKPTSLGTSWNVFGVPGSNVKTSNPYARMGNTSRK